MIEGWYYLHTNGDLIYKGADYTDVSDLRDSDFVRAFWPVDDDDRMTGWTLVVEALAAGARPDRVRELVEKWGLTDEDARQYVMRVGVNLVLDGDQWGATRQDFSNLQESPAGFGEHAYEALAELAKELGYQPSKMWGVGFAELAKVAA